MNHTRTFFSVAEEFGPTSVVNVEAFEEEQQRIASLPNELIADSAN